MLGVTLMLSTRAALGLDWYVEDPQDADEIEAALDLYWSDAPVEVRVGEPQGEGIWREGEQLVYSEDGRVLRQTVPDDPVTEVLLIRAWAQTLESQDQGWTPPPAVVVPTVPERLPPRQGWAYAVHLGSVLPNPYFGPWGHAGLEAWRLQGPYTLGVELSAGGRETVRYLDAEGGARGARYGGVALVGKQAAMDPWLGELQAGLGVRHLVVDAEDAFGARATLTRPTAVFRVRLWHHDTPLGRPGIGLVFAMDGLPGAWDDTLQLAYPDGSQPEVGPEFPHVRFNPWTLHLEISLARNLEAPRVPVD